MTAPQPAALPESATVLPDGSAFAIASFPLPADHWLYAPREYRDGEDDPIELPAPILNHRDHGDAVRAAIRYAVRSATMCGKEEDFDPDALVQNAMYALCGPFGAAALQSQPAAAGEADAEIDSIWQQHHVTNESFGELMDAQAFEHAARAILALRPQSESEPFGYFRALPFEWEQCGEHDEGAVALYTRPAPGVPEDVVRNAERYLWLRSAMKNGGSKGPYDERLRTMLHKDGTGRTMFQFYFWCRPEQLDSSIDAAMLAAAQAKGSDK